MLEYIEIVSETKFPASRHLDTSDIIETCLFSTFFWWGWG